MSSLPRAERATERLSPREWDVLRSIALGKTNAQIATSLFLTENTVKVHVKRILRKKLGGLPTGLRRQRCITG